MKDVMFGHFFGVLNFNYGVNMYNTAIWMSVYVHELINISEILTNLFTY